MGCCANCLAIRNWRLGGHRSAYRQSTNNPANTASGASSSSDTLVGWTVGGGVEWAFAPNWSVKGEYLYMDFGSISTSTNVASAAFVNPNVFSTSVDLKANIVRAGINYRF